MESVEVGPKSSLNPRFEMHHARMALHLHERARVRGASEADPGDVVAGEIDQHDMLGELLGVGSKISLEAIVFIGCRAARPGTGDGVGLYNQPVRSCRDGHGSFLQGAKSLVAAC